MSDLAVELLGTGERGGVARPRMEVRHRPDSIGVREDGEHVDPYFSSDLFIQTYLNPVTEVGCAYHNKPSCLCDVDVSKTADFVWNNCPPQLVGVETGPELVEVAANIWLVADVLGGGADAQLAGALVEHENMAEALEAVKAGKSLEEVKQLVPINAQTFLMFRRLFGVSRNRKVVPVARVIELAKLGIGGTVAQQVLFEETGVLYSLSSLRKARVRNGCTDHTTPGNKGKFPREQVIQLSDAGMKPARIVKILSVQSINIKQAQVSRIIRDQRKLRAKLGTNEDS